jgi:hypothetical protein
MPPRDPYSTTPEPRTADQGIGTFFSPKSGMQPYLENLGFLPGEKELRTSGNNILSALSDFDPVQGIMRGMTAAGVVADSRYSPEQRKEALIEAGLETIIPVSMIGAGKFAKEPAKKVLMDLLSPTGAPAEVSARPAAKAAPVDNTPDNPSRRKFLEGAGAAVLAAGVTPDILAEIVPKITRAAARVAPDLLKNPLVMAAAKIKALKKSTDDLYASRGVISESTDSVADLARDRQLTANAYEKIDTVENVFKSLADPKTGKQTIKEAPDDVLEEILSVQYEGSTSAFERIQAQMEGVDGFDPATEIAQEIKRRGLDTAKNKEGILQFPYARQFMEDVLGEGGMPNLNTSFKNPITNMSKNAAKLLEDQLFDVTKNIRGFGPTSNIAATPNLKVDNPGGDWLADKLEYAKEDRAKARVENSYQANLGNSAGVTGYFPEALQLDPNILAKVKGAMGEEAHRASGDKIKRLQKSIQEKGYDPSPILVHVREDGVPFIVEGNTRVAEAIESGRSSIPVEIKYLRGAETVDGPFNPEKLLIPDSVESIPPKIAKVFHTTKTKNYAGEDVLDFSLGPDSLDKALPTGNYGPAIYFSPDVSYPKQLNTSNSRMVEADIDESNFLNIRDNAPVADFQRDAFLDTIDTLSDAKGNAPKVEYNPENNTAKISLVQTEKSVGTREGPYELTINFNKPEKFFNGVKDLAYRIRSAADGDNRANMVEIFKASKIPGILGGYAQEGHIGVFDPSVIKSQSTAQRYAEGGPVGIGTLNNTAKDMFRGPRGVGAFMSYMVEGGEAQSPVSQAAQAVKKEYPMFEDVPVFDSTSKGMTDDRQMEAYLTSEDSPYGAPGIEVFNPNLQGEELKSAVLGEMLHYAPEKSEKYRLARQDLLKSMTPEQEGYFKAWHEKDAQSGDKRDFNTWMEVSGLDSFIRGKAVGQWPDFPYTTEQGTIVNKMMGLLAPVQGIGALNETARKMFR